MPSKRIVIVRVIVIVYKNLCVFVFNTIQNVPFPWVRQKFSIGSGAGIFVIHWFLSISKLAPVMRFP